MSRSNTGPAYRTRTRLQREADFVMGLCSARSDKLHERTVEQLARDYGVAPDFVRRKLAERLAGRVG